MALLGPIPTRLFYNSHSKINSFMVINRDFKLMSKRVYEALVYLYKTEGPTVISNGVRLEDSVEITLEYPGDAAIQELDELKAMVAYD